MIDAVRKLMTGPGLRAQLLRGGVGSLAVKVIHSLLAFCLAVVLARTLGPEGYGVYAFALTVLTLLAIPAQAGLPVLVIRETARAQGKKNWGLMRGLWRWATVWVLLFSVVIMGILGALLFGVTGLAHPRASTLAAGLLLVPLIALANVRSAALKGLRRVVQGQFPESIFRPALLLLSVFSVMYWTGRPELLTSSRVIVLYVGSALAAFLLGAWMLRRNTPTRVKENPLPEYNARAWRRAILPLALIGGIQIINKHMDIVVLSIFTDDVDLGVYRAVSQLSLLVVFGLYAMNQVLQPYIAGLYEQKEMARLQSMVTTSSRVIFVMALPVVMVFVVFGSEVMTYVFGEQFHLGAFALAILACGQLFNSAMGSVEHLLNMSGHEKETMRGMGLSLFVNVSMNFILIPKFGIEGAATSTVISLVVWNVYLRKAVRKHTGIETAVFAKC